MSRGQRMGLAALLVMIIVMQAAFIDVLRYFTPVFVPKASVILLWAGGLAAVALLVGGEDE
jgi:hypothetical protein